MAMEAASSGYAADRDSYPSATVPSSTAGTSNAGTSNAWTSNAGTMADADPSPIGEIPPSKSANSFILYRGEKLRAMKAGEKIPGLESVLKDLLATSSSSTDVEESQKYDTWSKSLIALGKGEPIKGMKQAYISQVVSGLWKRETPDVLAKYAESAAKKKVEVSGCVSDVPSQWLTTACRTISRLQIWPQSSGHRISEKGAGGGTYGDKPGKEATEA